MAVGTDENGFTVSVNSHVSIVAKVGASAAADRSPRLYAKHHTTPQPSQSWQMTAGPYSNLTMQTT